MNSLRFPILGPEIPPMLGREEIMQRLCSNLTKSTPSHLSVVGPRFAGKSVILKALADRMRAEGSPYFAVIFWDLGHQIPSSDAEFMKILCRLLGEGIKAVNRDYGEHLLSVDEGEYAEICEVMDALYDDGQMILMLWDGFDKPLNSGMLTRNLWDNLLELCRKPSFRLVTSTRRELHQLIRDEESVTSDFWGVFEGVVRVATFEDNDIELILASLENLTFQAGAKTELLNWSAGFPPLFLEILNRIIEEVEESGRVDNRLVNLAAGKAKTVGKCSAILDALWQDCSAGAKDLYRVLIDHRELPVDEVGREESSVLIEKGFARKTGRKILPACRMLEERILDTGQNAGSMARLFGSWGDYQANIRGLLERRLSHIPSFDERLYRLVARAIEDIPDFPNDCLNNLTGIEERALDLIWQREFGNERAIPQRIITYWTSSPRDRDRLVSRMMHENSWVVPSDRGSQVGLLQLLTGSKNGFDARARTTSKDTYVLINAIHSYRNRNQHGAGQNMHLGVAVAAIMSCLELLDCLDREFPT